MINQLLMLLNRKKQKAFYFGEDRIIDEVDLPIDKAYLSDKKKGEKWHLVHDLLMPVQGKKRLYLMISPRDSIPLDPLEVLPDKTRKKLTGNISHIARRALHSELTKIEKEGARNKLAESIKFVVILTGVLFAILAILVVAGRV